MPQRRRSPDDERARGVEIDYCPECRGVWLDRGELDKILDRAAAEITRGSPAGRAARRRTTGSSAIPGALAGLLSRVDGQLPELGRRPKKKEHWLSELFD